MSKMYGKKRTSTAAKHFVMGQWRTDYEMGHLIFRSRSLELPADAAKNMREGHNKAALEKYQFMVSQLRKAFREGRVSVLPKYRGLVAGIVPGDFRREDRSRARYPLKRGAKQHPIYKESKEKTDRIKDRLAAA